MAPKVDIYILHCESPKGDELLEETLQTLEAQDYEDFTITVIENGSDTPHIAGSHNRIHIRENVGVARGYNVALHHFLDGVGGYALLINNDVAADRAMVSQLVRTAETGLTTGIVCPRIFYYGTQRIWYDGGIFNPWTGVARHPGIRKIGPPSLKPKATVWATGCCMLIKREVIESVGTFDETFSPAYGEDIEYSLRAREWGWRIMVAPKAKLWHKVSQSLAILS